MSREYFSAVVPISATVKEIKAAVLHNTDGWNGERECSNAEEVASMRVVTLEGCYTYEEARNYYQKNDDFYWGGYIVAIPYVDPTNKKTKDLERRIKETQEKSRSYMANHRVADQKAAFIGCPECKSKIAKFYFERAKQSYLYKTDNCPVCGASLLSETSKKTLQGYRDKIAALEKELEAEKKRLCSKPTHYYALCGVHN